MVISNISVKRVQKIEGSHSGEVVDLQMGYKWIVFKTRENGRSKEKVWTAPGIIQGGVNGGGWRRVEERWWWRRRKGRVASSAND